MSRIGLSLVSVASLVVLFVFVSANGQAPQALVDPSSVWTEEPKKFVCADSLSEKQFVLTRLESGALPGSASAALTIQSDPDNEITILGKQQPDFAFQYCGRGAGRDEAEARGRLREVGMTLAKDVVSLNNVAPEGRLPRGAFFVEAPANALTVIHASSSSVEVRNMSGAVWLSALRSRATIVNTTGSVDAAAGHSDTPPRPETYTPRDAAAFPYCARSALMSSGLVMPDRPDTSSSWARSYRSSLLQSS